MFRRRRKQGDTADERTAGDGAPAAEEEATAERSPGRGVQARPGRENGPFDVSEVEDPSAAGGRVDLGGIWLPVLNGMELRFEVEEQSQAVVGVGVVVGESAVQVQAFAAPRSEGVWADVRREIADGITSQGGHAVEHDGPFGPQLRAEVPVALPDGSVGAQSIRFVGVDGPRWFLRGLFSGRAVDDLGAAAPLEELFRGVVVVRGKEAMAPRELLPLRLPQLPGPPSEEDGGPLAVESPQPDLDPFERGPEITEVR